MEQRAAMEYVTRILHRDGTSTDCVLNVDEIGDQVRLRLQYADRSLESAAPYSWAALIAVRTRLEASGDLIACHGGCRNVFLSPMSFDMSGGSRAYRLSLGKRARTDDLVTIWELAETGEPATIEEQQAFYDAWLVSLRLG